MPRLRIGPLVDFFAKHTDFVYNPARPPTSEFYRLCDSYGWRRNDDSEEKKVARQGFQDALTMQFNNIYGTNEYDITNWKAICDQLGMNPVPESRNACREAFRSTHVNLVDLVHTFGTQTRPAIFPTVVALSQYTKQTGKFFPRDNAHAGGLLRFLLRQIMNPELSRNEGGRARGRGGGRRT